MGTRKDAIINFFFLLFYKDVSQQVSGHLINWTWCGCSTFCVSHRVQKYLILCVIVEYRSGSWLEITIFVSSVLLDVSVMGDLPTT